MVPLKWTRRPPEEQLRRSGEFLELFQRRRSVRHYSERPVPRKILENIIRTAATAPSGANKQPWKFVLVDDPGLKQSIREAAEEEEKATYERRMPRAWADDLRPLGTDWRKEFLEVAPALVVVFKEKYAVDPQWTFSLGYWNGLQTRPRISSFRLGIRRRRRLSRTSAGNP
jgi:nitroreductase